MTKNRKSTIDNCTWAFSWLVAPFRPYSLARYLGGGEHKNGLIQVIKVVFFRIQISFFFSFLMSSQSLIFHWDLQRHVLTISPVTERKYCHCHWHWPCPCGEKLKTFLTLPLSLTDTVLTRPLSWQEAGNLKPFLHLKLIWIYHFEFQLMVYCLITRRWKLGNLAILEGRLQLIKLLSWISNKLWNVVLKSFLKIKVQKTMNI